LKWTLPNFIIFLWMIYIYI